MVIFYAILTISHARFQSLWCLINKERTIMWKIMKLAKMNYLFIAILLSFVICCTNDDEQPFPTNKDWKTADSLIIDGISVYFRMIRSDGTPSNSFSYGENICCNLLIKNNTNDTITISKDYGVADIQLGRELFSIYTNQGSYIGKPFETKVDEDAVLVIHFTDQEEINVTIPLFDRNVTFHNDISNSRLLPGKWEAMKMLGRGRYYSEFPIWYRTNPEKADSEIEKKIFKVDFLVI